RDRVERLRAEHAVSLHAPREYARQRELHARGRVVLRAQMSPPRNSAVRDGRFAPPGLFAARGPGLRVCGSSGLRATKTAPFLPSSRSRSFALHPARTLALRTA